MPPNRRPANVPANTSAAILPSSPALNDQQESFCQAYVYYGNAALACREAGYAPGSARQTGHKLLQRPAVAQRIEAIRLELAAEGCRKTETLLGKLENVYNRALEDRSYHAASRTVEIQARLAGLMPSMAERLRAADMARALSPEETAENRES